MSANRERLRSTYDSTPDYATILIAADRQKQVDRRAFVKKCASLGIKTVLADYLFFLGQGALSPLNARESESIRFDYLSLRDLARQKLHHGNDCFYNPFLPNYDRSIWQVLRWKLFNRNEFKQFYGQERIRPVVIDWNPIRQYQGVSITFLKHATVLIKDLDHYILVDPVLFGLWYFRDFSPLSFDIQAMPSPHTILITHGHYDHLDTRSLALYRQSSHIVAPLGYDDVFADLQVRNRTALDWFESYGTTDRSICLLPCNHWTMRNPLKGQNRSLWGSFLIRTAGGPTIFIAGDAAYFNRFQEIGDEFSIDLAVFNLGAYEPRWFMAQSHMNPLEVAAAFKELRANRLMIVHWGTFRLGDEPVHFPPQDLQKALATEGILDRLVHLDHGQTLYYRGNDIVDTPA